MADFIKSTKPNKRVVSEYDFFTWYYYTNSVGTKNGVNILKGTPKRFANQVVPLFRQWSQIFAPTPIGFSNINGDNYGLVIVDMGYNLYASVRTTTPPTFIDAGENFYFRTNEGFIRRRAGSFSEPTEQEKKELFRMIIYDLTTLEVIFETDPINVCSWRDVDNGIYTKLTYYCDEDYHYSFGVDWSQLNGALGSQAINVQYSKLSLVNVETEFIGGNSPVSSVGTIQKYMSYPIDWLTFKTPTWGYEQHFGFSNLLNHQYVNFGVRQDSFITYDSVTGYQTNYLHNSTLSIGEFRIRRGFDQTKHNTIA